MSDKKNDEPQFTIQPVPKEASLAETANPFSATGPHIPDTQVAQNLEQPKSREELHAEAKKLNE